MEGQDYCYVDVNMADGTTPPQHHTEDSIDVSANSCYGMGCFHHTCITHMCVLYQEHIKLKRSLDQDAVA